MKFWIPKPKMWGWRAFSLLFPALSSAVGFFAFGVLAYSFTELTTLPTEFRRSLVLVGSFALAFASEVGTLSVVVEIFRKAGSNHSVRNWDWAGLAISSLATLGTFLLAFAALLGVRATWSESVQLYGPIILGILVAADSYVGMAEFGLFLASHDERMRTWSKQRDAAIWGEHDREQASGKQSVQDTQEIPITQLEHQKGKPTELERLLAEGKTAEEIAMLWNRPLPIVRQLIAGQER